MLFNNKIRFSLEVLKVKSLYLESQEGLTEFDYLEQIYKKVKLQETVKFNGKVYMRVTPRNNKYYKNPYHFYILNHDIYSGNVKLMDEDGELVNSICNYKIEIKS